MGPMTEGRPSRTALAVAWSRAAHQRDAPRVLDDPLATRIVGEAGRSGIASAARPVRFWMAARSRVAEDALAAAVARGVDQYVVLGAGLDTFAYRNPFADLRTFEVDFPATQAWKRRMLEGAAIPVPASATFAPVDFERETLASGLADAGFEADRPAFFSWLGVTMYLTPEAFRSTLAFVGARPPGSGVTLDYVVARKALGWAGRVAYDGLSRRVGRVGEPLRLAFEASAMAEALASSGFGRSEDLDADAVMARYGGCGPTGLAMRAAGLGRIATAWRDDVPKGVA